MKHVNLLIKPAAGLCNMRCGYCFYHELSKDRDQALMSTDTAQRLIERAMGEAEKSVSFAFQGGEPTLAGLDFFRNFVAGVRRAAKPGVQVAFAIQTNGLVVDDEWARFFAQNRFLVGLSLDGDADMHNHNRPDAAGKGTFARVMAARDALEKAGAQYNILSVVTAAGARRIGALYGWYKKQGVRFLQFIACLDPTPAVRGQQDYSLTPARYGDFLCTLFDAWYRDWQAGQYVSIRLFDDYVHMAAGLPSGTCATSGSCGAYLVVESDGSAYPCDFYCTGEWRLGSIHEQSLEQLAQSEKAQRFLQNSQPVDGECRGCEYYAVCRGGCMRDRIVGAEGVLGNYYCAAFKRFFAHALPRIRQMAAAELRAMGQGAAGRGLP